LAQHPHATAGGFRLHAFVKFGMTHDKKKIKYRCERSHLGAA